MSDVRVPTQLVLKYWKLATLGGIVALIVLCRIFYLGGVLQVYNVTDTDSGTYVCQALIDSNSNTDIPQKRASLSVIPGKMFKVFEDEIFLSNFVRFSSALFSTDTDYYVHFVFILCWRHFSAKRCVKRGTRTRFGIIYTCICIRFPEICKICK